LEERDDLRASNLKRGVRAIYREMTEVSDLLGNGDPTSTRQAVMRMKNIRRLANSIGVVLDKWEIEIEKENEDRKDFISSILRDIESMNTKGLGDEVL